MTRVTLRAAALAALACVSLRPAAAQAPAAPPAGSAWLSYGKWATAAGAVALTVLGAREHRRSEANWDRLLTLCRANHTTCALGADGRYRDPDAERHFQATLQYDRRARLRLLAGQAALLGAVGLFLLDRRSGTDDPDNIPYAPLRVFAEPQGGGARVGVQVAF